VNIVFVLVGDVQQAMFSGLLKKNYQPVPRSGAGSSGAGDTETAS
jgi:hypothetical protein